MSEEKHRPGLEGLPVEPLSDLGWQRIERRLFAGGAILPAEAPPRGDALAHGPRAPASRRRLVVGLGAAALAAAASALLLWPRAGDRGQVAADRDDPGVRPPSRIATAEAPTSVSLGDVALDVAAHSALLVDGDREGGVLIVLERGQVQCRVAPRAGRPPVVVHSGDVRVEVVGTEFAVTRVGESARVVVHEGVVTVLQAGRLTRVVAGQTWSGAAEVEETPRGSAAHETAPPRPAHETARGPVRSRSTARPRGAAGKGAERGAGGERDQDRDGAASVPGSRAAAAAESRAAPPPSEKTRYEQAARLEASDPAAALAIYDRLARGSGAWAAIALYAQGRLELDLGHRDRARALLETYMTLHPRGANKEDARQLLDQLR